MRSSGRAAEGLAFLAANEAAWSEGNSFAVHIAWHRALLHLQQGDAAAALAVYDQRIAGAPRANLAALADASALLWRLELQESDPGRRWSVLADRWESATLEEARPFFAIHAVMAFAAAGRIAALKRTLKSLPRLDPNEAARSLPDQALALPVCAALSAFAVGDYCACIARLERVRHIARSCGGSVAQCKLLEMTLAEATLRAQKPCARSLAA